MTRIRALRPRGPSTTIGSALALIALLAAALKLGATTAPATADAATPGPPPGHRARGRAERPRPCAPACAARPRLPPRPGRGRRPIRPRHGRRRPPPAGPARARGRWRRRSAHPPRARIRSSIAHARAGSPKRHQRGRDADQRPPGSRPHVAGSTTRPRAGRDPASAGSTPSLAAARNRSIAIALLVCALALSIWFAGLPRSRRRAPAPREPARGARRPSRHRVRRRDGGSARPRRRQDREGLRPASLGPARGRRRARRPARGASAAGSHTHSTGSGGATRDALVVRDLEHLGRRRRERGRIAVRSTTQGPRS